MTAFHCHLFTIIYQKFLLNRPTFLPVILFTTDTFSSPVILMGSIIDGSRRGFRPRRGISYKKKYKINKIKCMLLCPLLQKRAPPTGAGRLTFSYLILNCKQFT